MPKIIQLFWPRRQSNKIILNQKSSNQRLFKSLKSYLFLNMNMKTQFIFRIPTAASKMNHHFLKTNCNNSPSTHYLRTRKINSTVLQPVISPLNDPPVLSPPPNVPLVLSPLTNIPLDLSRKFVFKKNTSSQATQLLSSPRRSRSNSSSHETFLIQNELQNEVESDGN